MSIIQGVVFDLDGVIIDSEALAIQSWQMCLAPYGATLSQEQYRSLVGTSHVDSLEYIQRHAGVAIDLPALDESFWQHMLGLVERGGLAPMPGVLPLIRELAARGLPMAVASNSRTGYVGAVLDRIGVGRLFACAVGADQVARGKPAPDVYLHAATCLGLPPQSCLAIEDSPVGAQSARSAGLFCVLVPNPLLGQVAMGDHITYPSLASLRQNLDVLLGDPFRTPTNGTIVERE